MSSRHVSRRFVVTALGSGVAIAPLVARAAASKVAKSVTSGDASQEAPPPMGELLVAPLTVGSQVAGCQVERIGELEQGAVGFVLSDRSGQRFAIEVCARDTEAPRSPAETAKFQLYVVNEGDGSVPTIEEHGLAAMNLALVIRNNEHELDTSEFLTFRERLDRYAGDLIRPL